VQDSHDLMEIRIIFEWKYPCAGFMEPWTRMGGAVHWSTVDRAAARLTGAARAGGSGHGCSP
jgi:hypothetical protein